MKFTRPGRIGKPAASAEVKPAGRSALDLRFQIAPEPAEDWPRARYRVSYVSNNVHGAELGDRLGSTMIACRSEPPSIGVDALRG